MKSSFLPKYEPKRFLPCIEWHSTGQKSLQYIWFVFWEKRWLHTFILKFTDLKVLYTMAWKSGWRHIWFYHTFRILRFFSKIKITKNLVINLISNFCSKQLIDLDVHIEFWILNFEYPIFVFFCRQVQWKKSKQWDKIRHI